MKDIDYFNKILSSFKLKAQCVSYNKLDNYFYYDLKLHPNARVRDINKYADELSLALQTPGKPSLKILHAQGLVRVEFALPRENSLKLFDYFDNQIPKGQINCLLGQTVDGQKLWMDLTENPHMLVSGTTGSGKSILLHNLVANLLNYNDVDICLVDPKRIEFSEYESLRRTQVFYTYDDSLQLLRLLLEVMEARYEYLRLGQNIDSLRSIVLIIDEFADLILQDKDDIFFSSLCKLAQKCRAAKIYIVLATQRPSVNIINGSIKANFPARIACKVASYIDSKVILDYAGAENLLGKGDALVRDNFRAMERFQIAYTDPLEIRAIFESL